MPSLNDFGAMNALLAVINNGDEGSSDVVIAKYLLTHFNRLESLSIYDIATECFTTRQSIRRFCRDLGLGNFQSFKRYLEHEYDHTSGYYFADAEGESGEDYPAHLMFALTAMAADINKAAGLFADAFAGQMHAAYECVFLVSDIYTAACAEFQKQMILSDKMVRIVSKAYHESSLIANLSDEDVLVTISISGRWASEVGDSADLERTRAHTVLLTTSHDGHLSASYDDVYLLSLSEQPSAKTVYHQFGIMYVLDLLQQRYREKYCR